MLQSVQTALRVFELVAEQQPVGVSELARQLEATKSTIQRCLQTLHEAGWIRPDGAEKTKWVITARILNVGRRVSDGTQLTQAALPVMQRLREITQETIHLAIADDRDSVLLERLESPLPVRIFYAVGSRVPLNASATGKAMLSRWDARALDAFLGRGLKKMGPKTITNVDALRKELALTARRGWSAAIDELGEGASAVAAPILDPSGAAIAAVSISAPSARLKEAARRRFADLITDAAREISESLYGR